MEEDALLRRERRPLPEIPAAEAEAQAEAPFRRSIRPDEAFRRPDFRISLPSSSLPLPLPLPFLFSLPSSIPINEERRR